MNLGQILERVDLLIDNNISTEQKVNTINEISKRLFRKFPVPDKFYKFETTSIPYYDLPKDAAEERINSVIIDGVEYVAVQPDNKNPNPPERFCMVTAGKLFIHPNVEGKTAFLYYKPRHVELYPNDLSAIPTFPEDYHELLVYGLAKWIAEIQRDVDMINNFQRQMDEIYNDMENDLMKMGISEIKPHW